MGYDGMTWKFLAFQPASNTSLHDPWWLIIRQCRLGTLPPFRYDLAFFVEQTVELLECIGDILGFNE